MGHSDRAAFFLASDTACKPLVPYFWRTNMIRRDTSWLAALLALVAILMVGCAGDETESDDADTSDPVSDNDSTTPDSDDEDSADLLYVSLELPGMT